MRDIIRCENQQEVERALDFEDAPEQPDPPGCLEDLDGSDQYEPPDETTCLGDEEGGGV